MVHAGRNHHAGAHPSRWPDRRRHGQWTSSARMQERRTDGPGQQPRPSRRRHRGEWAATSDVAVRGPGSGTAPIPGTPRQASAPDVMTVPGPTPGRRQPRSPSSYAPRSSRRPTCLPSSARKRPVAPQSCLAAQGCSSPGRRPAGCSAHLGGCRRRHRHHAWNRRRQLGGHQRDPFGVSGSPADGGSPRSPDSAHRGFPCQEHLLILSLIHI